VEEAAEPHEVLLKELRRRCPLTHYRKVSVRPSASEADECFEVCKNADKLLIITYNLHLYPAQREFVGRLLGLGKPAVVAAVRDPYDLAFVSEARARIATYSFRSCSLKALVEVLFGESEANGTMPVELHL
jgi:beta-N-acetylhexosaminidase